MSNNKDLNLCTLPILPNTSCPVGTRFQANGVDYVVVSTSAGDKWSPWIGHNYLPPDRIAELEHRVWELERQVAKLTPSTTSTPSTPSNSSTEPPVPSDSERLDWILQVLYAGGWNRLMLRVRWEFPDKPTREDIDRAMRVEMDRDKGQR